MDPLSAAANIIAVINAANKLIVLCKRFLEAVRAALCEFCIILVQVSCFRFMLDELHILFSCNRAPATMDTLSSDHCSVECCLKVMTELEDMLPAECLLATDS